LFVLVSLFFWLRVLDKAEYSAFEFRVHVKLSYRIVSYRIVPCVGCDAPSISQTSVKAKDRPRAKKYTAADLGRLATDNDQQSNQRLSQMPERVRFGRWWTF